MCGFREAGMDDTGGNVKEEEQSFRLVLSCVMEDELAVCVCVCVCVRVCVWR